MAAGPGPAFVDVVPSHQHPPQIRAHHKGGAGDVGSQSLPGENLFPVPVAAVQYQGLIRRLSGVAGGKGLKKGQIVGHGLAPSQ